MNKCKEYASRQIVGIGETVLDIVFRDSRPSAAVPGGSTFNAMISLGRTAVRDFSGTDAVMITQTGDDHIGDIVVSFMEKNGVSTRAVTRQIGTQTHISIAFLDENNNAQYEFYKDHASAVLDEDKTASVSFRKDDLVLTGSYFAINPKIHRFTSRLLEDARKSGAVIYYDINFRKNHLSDLQETIGYIEENCRLSDFVRGSNEDFDYLFSTADPQTIYREHIASLCPNFICTCGAAPVHVFTPQFHLTFPVENVRTVSTIGAGDNFNAGFLYAMLSLGLGAGSFIDEAAWKRLIGIAGQFSADVCSSIENYVGPDFRIRE